MIRGYNKSFLAKLVNYNDPRVESYADNLYEKIRQLGVLPSFVVRDKLVRFRNDIIDKSVSAPIFAKDDRFTFGYAYRGGELGTSGNFLNTGLVWDFEFELCFEDPAETRTVEFLNGFIKVSSDYNVQVGDVTFSSVVAEYNKVNHFRINRVHEMVELYVNKEYIGQQSLPTDEDVLFDTVYKVSSGIPPLTAIKYGLLYNWYAANDIRNISSDDEWTVPFHEDWNNLKTLVSSDSRLLKESGTTYWGEGNEGTNQLNFNARGGGIRYQIFEGLKYNSVYWCKGIYDSGYNEYTAMFHLDISNYCYFFFPLYSIEPYIAASIRLFRDASESELSLDDGTACAPYIGNDGKVYPTVKIGEKVYLAQNLCETKFRDGSWIEGFDGGVYTPISNAAWVALTTAGVCAYNNDLSNVLI